MGTSIAWAITGFSVAILLCMWHWIVWRELEAQRRTLRQLARQIALSRDTAWKAKGSPYESGTKHSLETSISVYSEAVERYNRERNKPCCYIPSRLLGFKPAEVIEGELSC